MKFKFVILISLLVLLIPFSVSAVTIIPTNSCNNNTIISTPKYCSFDINSEQYTDMNEIDVTVNQNSVIGTPSNLSIQTDANNNSFNVYITQYNLPTYIIAKNKSGIMLDQIVLVGGSNDLNVVRTYKNIDKNDVTSKWILGLLFAMLGMMLFFDAFFSDRFVRYV